MCISEIKILKKASSANDWNLTLRCRRFPCLALLPVLDSEIKKKKKLIKKIKQRKKQNVWKKTFDNPYRNIKSIFSKSKYVMYFVSKRLIYYFLTGKQKLLFISQKWSNLNEIYLSAKFLHVYITTKKTWQNRADYKS